ncbi:cytochrome P450 [Planotetraspora phitsanulokensis]|uniref:Cytochrome P450 n=1 Tax=Planotetraspora phitsanulokensis TaxID=575192 RepID=A0A8J3UAU7_9ACTN|nr:cytochrome P450 [Planotetraspora phitsanulokensis]GII40242.1 cytochrome P450 [Planotetraspora phitsanulokensis]
MDINLVDQDHYASKGAPHDQLRWLRANAPVFWHEGDAERGWPGFWALTKHEDVVHVSRHSDLFSSAAKLALFDEMPEEQRDLQRMMMLNQDPPEHTRRRSLVNRGFTPRAISKLEEHIREICHQLVDEARDKPEADFVRDFAAPLPLYVICELLGAPLEDRDKIFEWSNRMIGAQDPDYADPDEGQNAAMEVYAYANELAAARKDDPQDDIVTKLLQPAENGEVLSVDEFDLFVLLLVVAGNETTRNAASGGMLALFENPEQWARLVADRTLAGPAADEIVRWVSPVNLFRRTATTNTVVRDQEIAEGDKVVVFYTSANRDEDVFQNPDVFDIGRTPNPQIGFGGGGAHFCLGNHLAKLELRVLFEVLSERIPTLQQAGEATRLRSSFINGIKTLPVTL